MPGAELVHVQTSDGVRLDGVIARADDPPRLGVDLVIFHHGVGANFYRPSLGSALADRLLASGCSVLRVNNRGHDHLYSGPQGWLGAAFEVVDDCRLDFSAWLDFAEAAGFRRVALWGHSLGAVKTIYYLATEHDRRVECAIASSPPRFHYESFVAGEGGVGRAASIAEAEARVAAGRADELVVFDIDLARPMWFSAMSSVDKYGPADRYDFFRHLEGVEVPLLVTIGSLEGGFSFDALARRGPELSGSFPAVSFQSVEGADHFYLSRVEDVWSLVTGWLERSIETSRS